MSYPRNISDEKLMHVCVTFMRGSNATHTANECNELWKSQDSDFSINREQVYPLLGEARERGFFALTPPENEILGSDIASRYGHEPGDIKVVQVRGDLDPIASATARIILRLIQILGKRKRGKNRRIHLGLGAGHTSMKIAQHLAAALRVEKEVPPLTLHAITLGFDVAEPQKAAICFFSYFENLPHDIQYVGLFAPPFFQWDRYDEIRTLPGAEEAFKVAPEIDIVVTSLASRKDPHGDLNRFMKLVPNDALAKRAWVGDVQYRPYGEEGPIELRSGRRAVTLFELEELRALAEKRDKYVVLVSGPCGGCGRTRTDALTPLIANPKLKVWTHLVLDLDTARELVV